MTVSSGYLRVSSKVVQLRSITAQNHDFVIHLLRQLLAFLLVTLLILLMSPPAHAQTKIRAGELVLTLKDTTATNQLRAHSAFSLMRQLGSGQALIRMKTLPSGLQTLGQVINAPADIYKSECDALVAQGIAQNCSPNFIYRASATPNDTFYSVLYGLEHIGAPAAWDISTGSSSIIVAVIDSGIEYTHSDLAANMWTNSQETPGNSIDDDSNGYVDDYHGANFISSRSNDDPLDDNGHGTHCAGTVGAVGNNSRGVVGVNWNVKLMALKFLDAGGEGSTSDGILAIQYAVANGAKVISASWGGPGYSAPLESAINSAGNQGVLFVAAAGNEGIDNDTNTNKSYPSSFNLSNLISVASTDANDNFSSSFSNYGATSVHVAAPGEDIGSTYRGNQYAYLTGTSMATPHVAGLAALVLSVKSMSPSALKSLIINNVQTKASLQGKVSSGGLINAQATLLAANGSTATPTPTPTPNPSATPTPNPDDGGGSGGGGVNDDSPNFIIQSGAYDTTTKQFSWGRRIVKNGLIQVSVENTTESQEVTLKFKIRNARCSVTTLSVSPESTSELLCKAVPGFRGKVTSELYNSDGIFANSEVMTFAPAKQTLSSKVLSASSYCKRLAKQVRVNTP